MPLGIRSRRAVGSADVLYFDTAIFDQENGVIAINACSSWRIGWAALLSASGARRRTTTTSTTVRKRRRDRTARRHSAATVTSRDPRRRDPRQHTGHGPHPSNPPPNATSEQFAPPSTGSRGKASSPDWRGTGPPSAGTQPGGLQTMANVTPTGATTRPTGRDASTTIAHAWPARRAVYAVVLRRLLSPTCRFWLRRAIAVLTAPSGPFFPLFRQQRTVYFEVPLHQAYSDSFAADNTP